MPKFKFNFIGEADSREEAIANLSKNEDLNVSLSSLEIEEISEEEFLSNGASGSIKKSESYLNALPEFYEKMGIMGAEELAKKNPYIKSADKKKGENLLGKFSAENKALIALIGEYFVPLPRRAEFEDLRLQRGIVEISIKKHQNNPERFYTTVSQAFKSYQGAYIKEYLAFITERNQFLKGFWKDVKMIKKKLLTLATLEEIDIFKNKKYPEISKKFAQIKEEFVAFDKVDSREIKKVLEKSPAFKGIYFTDLGAEEVCAEFLSSLDSALESYFATIRTKSVIDILTNSEKSSVKKLIKLLSFTRLDKIVSLFNSKTAPVIGMELRKLLSKKK